MKNLIQLLLFTSCYLHSVHVLAWELKLHPNGQVANIQVSTTEYARYIQFENNDIENLSHFLYYYFKDDFDFIFFTHNEDSIQAAGAIAETSYYGRYSPIKNDVEGIGERLQDQSQRYGSAGRLQGIIHFPYRNALENGPALHELMHRWGNDILPTTVSAHWGFSSVGGQLGGFDYDTLTLLDDNTYKASISDKSSFGTFANGGNAIPYSAFELYLMGLIPATEVPDIYVATNPEWLPDRSGFIADGFDIYSMDTITAEQGVRQPDFNSAQKAFRALFVVFSTADLSTEQWQEADRIASNFSLQGDDGSYYYNFWEATGGRASLQLGGLNESLIRDPSTPAPDIDSLKQIIDIASIQRQGDFSVGNQVSITVLGSYLPAGMQLALSGNGICLETGQGNANSRTFACTLQQAGVQKLEFLGANGLPVSGLFYSFEIRAADAASISGLSYSGKLETGQRIEVNINGKFLPAGMYLSLGEVQCLETGTGSASTRSFSCDLRQAGEQKLSFFAADNSALVGNYYLLNIAQGETTPITPTDPEPEPPSNSLSDWQRVLMWAENKYPALFPTTNTEDLNIDVYQVRFYPQSNLYLGLNQQDAGVYIYSPPLYGEQIVPVGPLLEFLNIAAMAAY